MLKTGLKDKTCVYGTIAETGKQFFRQYEKCNSEFFIPYLEALLSRFGKLILLLDRAPWHYTAKLTLKFLKEHKGCLKVLWFPTGWPELNPLEETWKQGKHDGELGGKLFDKFTEFQKAITTYYRTKRFNLSLFNYLS